jgi:hypothetical protein
MWWYLETFRGIVKFTLLPVLDLFAGFIFLCLLRKYRGKYHFENWRENAGMV